MKQITSWLLYHLGDLISKFLYFDCMSWLYPVYTKLMVKSSDLDVLNKIWKTPGK